MKKDGNVIFIISLLTALVILLAVTCGGPSEAQIVDEYSAPSFDELVRSCKNSPSVYVCDYSSSDGDLCVARVCLKDGVRQPEDHGFACVAMDDDS